MKTLDRLVKRDKRIEAYDIEEDGIFVYTADGFVWEQGDATHGGSHTRSFDTVREVMEWLPSIEVDKHPQ